MRAGQLDLLQNIVEQVAPLSRAKQKLLESADLVHFEAPDAQDLAFLAREFVQCTMPHKDPGPIPGWGRTNGFLALGITPGFDFLHKRSIGFPYGSIPRLILYWVNTEAVRTASRRLELGSSFADFIRSLGLDPSRGGPRSDHARVKNQLERLLCASITFQSSLQKDGLMGEHRMNLQVSSQSQLWWDPKKPEQVSLWDSWIELGEGFYQLITAAPVPVDLRALRALKKSPLALDLYAWSTHKALSVSRKGKAQFVPWKGLMEQFGADYTDPHNFKKKAKEALKKIQAVYPGLKLEDAVGGLVVLPSSRPAIASKPSRRGITG